MSDERGYLIFAVTELELRHAELLAYSIKIKMPSADITLAVPNINTVDKKYLQAFDQITQLPFASAPTAEQTVWQAYWCTPYEYTMVVDAKSIIKTDQTTTWDYLCDHHTVCFAQQVLDYKNNPIHSKYQNILKEEYQLKPVYARQFFFHNSSDDALAYFKLADVYFQNWQQVCNTFLAKQHIPDEFDANLMHTFVANHCRADVFALHSNILDYVDMDVSLVNRLLGNHERWTDKLNIWASENAKLKIQNFAVNNMLYYKEENFLTKELVDDQRNFYRTVTKNI